LREYRRKKSASITADLDTEGFVYRKWGGTQRCKRGDWVVNNRGDVHTVDGETFDRTYRMVSPGIYVKNAPVWAQRAEESGTIQTKEGSTAYKVGDYLVFNDPGGEGGYAMPKEEFHTLYELPEK
jgi:hypothetical protein